MREFETVEELNAAWKAGSVDEETYEAEYARLNASHGSRCACGAQASCLPLDGGPALCGDCMLEQLEGGDAGTDAT